MDPHPSIGTIVFVIAMDEGHIVLLDPKRLAEVGLR